jgi:hypothetical protein
MAQPVRNDDIIHGDFWSASQAGECFHITVRGVDLDALPRAIDALVGEDADKYLLSLVTHGYDPAELIWMLEPA